MNLIRFAFPLAVALSCCGGVIIESCPQRYGTRRCRHWMSDKRRSLCSLRRRMGLFDGVTPDADRFGRSDVSAGHRGWCAV
jgi:hypothetical protein